MKLKPEQRLFIVASVVGLGLLAIAGRFVFIQAIKAPILREMALQKQKRTEKFSPLRGDIVDRHGDALAISVPAVSLFAHPRKLDESNKRFVCKQLQNLAVLSSCDLLWRDSSFVWLGRDLPRDRLEPALQALRDIEGFGWQNTARRQYPKGALAGQILGFVGIDGVGLEGVERSLDTFLQPHLSEIEVQLDARRRLLLHPQALKGIQTERRNVQLTIDAALQARVESALSNAMQEFGGGAAIALVAEAQSSAIRAAAIVPGFDPNHFAKASAADWRVRFATDTFEPGSTVKPLVLAGALLAGHSLHEVVYAENGKYVVDRHEISDDEGPNTWLSLRNVVIKSSNIGAIKIAALLGPQGLADLYRKFGFGEKLNSGFQGEVRGILRPASRWSKLDFATASFGQGLSVTPLHLLQAYLIVANNGRYVPARIIERVYESESGREIWRPDSQAKEVFNNPEVFAAVRSVLAAVVLEGTGRRAAVEGLAIGGKTGTAQKPDLDKGGYRSDAYVAWFVGMFPIEAPRWVAVVLVDEPKTSIYGGAVAAPVFARIAEAIAIREGLSEVRLRGSERAELPSADVARLPNATEVIPDLMGLSLKSAGRVAQKLGVTLVAKGSGVVIEQEPKPGTAVNGNEVLRIVLAERPI